MGFPLRSNIFKAGTSEQAYFSKFPIQVAVLFSPTDQDFSQSFKDIFVALDSLTDEKLAFFAVLDPPLDWIKIAEKRGWWQEYSHRIGESHFSIKDHVLVREIARLFRIRWDNLPAIVVGTNLWRGEFITSGTSAFHIKRQLEVLTNLVEEWGEPNIGQIIETLQDSFGFYVMYHPPNDDLRYRFQRFYSILDSGTNTNFFDQEKYQYTLGLELRSVNITLSQVRRREDIRETESESTTIATDKIIEDATGRLVAPATVAMRVFDELNRDRVIVESFDDESLVMIETAIRVGNLLEEMTHGKNKPLLLGSLWDNWHWKRNKTQHKQEPFIDLTPGAQGIWKTFEREINLSVIQAARAARTVKMPELFTLHDKNLPNKQGRVHTGKKPVNINQLDWEDPTKQKHRFIELGTAWHVI